MKYDQVHTMARFSPSDNIRSRNLESPQLQGKWRELKWTVYLCLFTLVLSLGFYYFAILQAPPQLSSFSTFVPFRNESKHKLNNTDNVEDEERSNLGRILKEASMEGKTVIVTMMNQAYAEPNSTMDVFIEGFRVGEGTERLLRHVVVVCLDDKAYSRCLEVFPRRCFLLKTPGIDFSGERLFMKGDYAKMMWHRTEFLGSLLKLGYSFLFTDMDIVWLRDPFPRLMDADFQIACDRFNGNSTDTHNYANGGFKYVIANNRTIEFYNYWYESRLKFPGKNEQDVINIIKNYEYIKTIGLRMRFLDSTYFADFCQAEWDITKVCTMHGNCCIGQANKIKDLRQILEDWTAFLSNEDQKRGFREPMNCRRSLHRKIG